MLLRRKGKIYIDWKQAVLERDNYTCQHCFSTEVKLHPHHIKTWEEAPELRAVVENGLTLCTSCHNKHHHIGRVAWNKGQKMSLEQREKLSLAKLGKPGNRLGHKSDKPAWNAGTKGVSKGMPKGTTFSEDHRNKLSASKKGSSSWNKGLCGEKSHMKGRIRKINPITNLFTFINPQQELVSYVNK